MKPILYSADEKLFDSNGLGILNDAISCTVTQERNGMYELEMEYPVGGIHYENLVPLYIIMAQPDPITYRPQPFRIYETTKPLSGNITVYARHLAYDLMGIPVAPFTASTAAAALEGLTQNAIISCPFTFWTNKTTDATMTVEVPTSIWDLLKGNAGGILDVYGGEYEFDWWTVGLYKQRGAEIDTTIRYGVNLTGLKQSASTDNWCSTIYPYWVGEDGTLVTGGLCRTSGFYPFEQVRVVDYSEAWDAAPTADQLNARALSYLNNQKLAEPSVNIEFDFAHNTYDARFGAHTVQLFRVCDTIKVVFDQLGISTTATVIKTTYDAIAERYTKVEIGSKKQSLMDLIVSSTVSKNQWGSMTNNSFA